MLMPLAAKIFTKYPTGEKMTAKRRWNLIRLGILAVVILFSLVFRELGYLPLTSEAELKSDPVIDATSQRDAAL
jgi:hypothetical protein